MADKMRVWTLNFLVFLNGYVSLSLELIVLRQLSFYVGSAAVITSIIMGVFLGFMALGYWLGQARRIRTQWMRTILGASFIATAVVAVLAGSFGLITRYFEWMYSWGLTAGFVQTFVFSFALLSVGPFLFGFNTTLISRLLNAHNTDYTGNIMAMDTVGSVLGSMLTTLVLMPVVGVNYTLMLVTALACVGALIVWPRWWTAMAGAVILIAAYSMNSNTRLYRDFGILVNNANSTISVAGDGDLRVLYMNGLPMSMYDAGRDLGAEYINYINENFLYTLPRGKVHKILVLGAGGFTAGLRDDVNDYTFVDIEPTLKDITEQRFLGEKLGDNKHFVLRDASQFLKNTDEMYDVIILDVYSNSYQIPEDLVTAEFMTRIKSRVAPNGVILMNMVCSPTFADKYTRVFDNTFHTVFPQNTSRQIVGRMNPWHAGQVSNVIYIWYNRDNDGRIYTINKSPVIYDRY